MNRLLIGVVASTLLAGASYAAAETETQTQTQTEPATPMMLQLHNGQPVKVMVPKTEAAKVKDVKAGDTAIFLTAPSAAAPSVDEPAPQS